MSAETTLLAWTLVLAIVQILLAAGARTHRYGPKWNMGARDEAMPPLDPLPARLLRAQANLFETLPLFATAVLIAQIAGKLGGLSFWGAQAYFWARVAYVPLYAFGVRGVRTLAWGVGLLGLLAVIATDILPR